MSAHRDPPPEHICAAFGAKAADAEPLRGGSAWRCDSMVLRPVADKAKAVWQARALEYVDVGVLRVARPVRSTDGRWIISGWSASRYVAGTPEARADDIVLTAVRLQEPSAQLPRPDYPAARDRITGVADRVAWDEEDVPLNEAKGGGWFEVLAGARRPVQAPNQVVHGDLFGAVLFEGDSPPGIVDFSPYYRPAGWAAAVAAVDALAANCADGELLRRWAHLPEWPQLLLRAILFRLAANALDPDSTESALDGLRAAAREVSALL